MTTTKSRMKLIRQGATAAKPAAATGAAAIPGAAPPAPGTPGKSRRGRLYTNPRSRGER